MFGFSDSAASNLDADQLREAMETTDVVLIDVREPDEFRRERIEGAISQPLSQFDPRAVPPSGAKMVVLYCAGGVRSAKALERCQLAKVDVRHHLAGGISAWKAAGLPTVC